MADTMPVPPGTHPVESLVDFGPAIDATWERSGRRSVAAMAPVHVERRACGTELRAVISAARLGADGAQ